MKLSISKLIMFIIALQIINMSIDSPSSQINLNQTENQNLIETYVEYIAEVILKYNNAIPELKNRHKMELPRHKQLQPINKKTQEEFVLGNYTYPGQDHNNSDHKKIPQFIQEINPPPPKSI